MTYDNDNNSGKKPTFSVIQGGLSADSQKSENHKPELTVIEGNPEAKNPYAANSGKGPVKLIRLVTGEVLIAYYKPNSNFSLNATRPLLVMAQPLRDPNTGQMRLSMNMMIYMPFAADETFEFKLADVLNVVNPVPDMVKSYMQQTTEEGEEVPTPPAPPTGGSRFIMPN